MTLINSHQFSKPQEEALTPQITVTETIQIPALLKKKYLMLMLLLESKAKTIK